MPKLEALSAPISAQQPVGEDLSFSDEFDAILESRRADDPTLDQGDWVTDIKQADWPTVLGLCSDLLEKRTKDLRVAGWFAEANAQLNGFAGLAMSYRLVAQLCERYWDELHPQASGDDQEERIGAVEWLLINSEQWLRMLPIAQSDDGKSSFGLAAFEAAHLRGAGDDSHNSSLTDLGAIRSSTPHEFYETLCKTVPDCQAALDQLEKSVDTQLSSNAPSFTGLREQLKSLDEMVKRFAQEAGVLPDRQAAHTTADDTLTSDIETSPMPLTHAPLKTRRQALTQLREVARYFRETEPHSPVAYLADKAARWGEMPLHVWLNQVIKDENVRKQLEEMLDLEPPKPAPEA